jgi:hypothetical protein
MLEMIKWLKVELFKYLECIILKDVGSWAFQEDYTGCYNFLLTGSISIPLAQTYCICFTELNPDTKECASSKFERVL